MNQAIVIIGGYNSLWPAYLKMARDLEDLTGLKTIGVPLMPWHWGQARRSESGTPILEKVAETVAWARHKFGAERFILVGHSAGGVIARLYLFDGPVWGKVYAGVQHVPAVITLGSPHCCDRGTNTGWVLTDEANRLVPGTYFDQVTYRAVAGRSIRGNPDGRYWERRASRAYRYFAGQDDLWGDGVVPIRSAGLDGTEPFILDGVVHSRKFGVKWYGGYLRIVRRWWPAEEFDAH